VIRRRPGAIGGGCPQHHNNWSSIAGATSYVLPSTFSTARHRRQSTYLYATPQYQVSFIGVDPSTQALFVHGDIAGFGAMPMQRPFCKACIRSFPRSR